MPTARTSQNSNWGDVSLEAARTRVERTGYHGNLEEALAIAMLPTPRTSEVAASMTLDDAAARVQSTGYHSNLEEAVAIGIVRPESPALPPMLLQYSIELDSVSCRAAMPNSPSDCG